MRVPGLPAKYWAGRRTHHIFSFTPPPRHFPWSTISAHMNFRPWMPRHDCHRNRCRCPHAVWQCNASELHVIWTWRRLGRDPDEGWTPAQANSVMSIHIRGSLYTLQSYLHSHKATRVIQSLSRLLIRPPLNPSPTAALFAYNNRLSISSSNYDAFVHNNMYNRFIIMLQGYM